MAVIQIPNLPVAISLSGGEQFEIVQGGVSRRTSVNQIAFYAQNFPPNITPSGLFCTNRQFRSALVAIQSPAPNAMVEVNNNIPVDISDPVSIQWNYGSWVVEGDDVYLFTQTTLGYTDNQMNALIIDGLTYPL